MLSLASEEYKHIKVHVRSIRNNNIQQHLQGPNEV